MLRYLVLPCFSFCAQTPCIILPTLCQYSHIPLRVCPCFLRSVFAMFDSDCLFFYLVLNLACSTCQCDSILPMDSSLSRLNSTRAGGTGMVKGKRRGILQTILVAAYVIILVVGSVFPGKPLCLALAVQLTPTREHDHCDLGL